MSDAWRFKTEQLKSGREWRLLEDYQFSVALRNEGRLVTVAGTVPEGFVFDFASIPRMFWRIAPPAAGKHARASLIHDYLYVKKRARVSGVERSVDKRTADLVFKQAMLEDEVSHWKAKAMFRAVDWFGKGTWDD